MNKERFLIIFAVLILLSDILLVKIENNLYSPEAMDAYKYSGAGALITSSAYSYMIFFLYFFSFVFLHPALRKLRFLFLFTNVALIISALTHGFSVSSPLFVVTGCLYFVIVGMLAAMEPGKHE